jgi:hypothetical protein
VKHIENDKIRARTLSDLENNFTSQAVEKRRSQKVDLLSMISIVFIV